MLQTGSKGPTKEMAWACTTAAASNFVHQQMQHGLCQPSTPTLQHDTTVLLPTLVNKQEGVQQAVGQVQPQPPWQYHKTAMPNHNISDNRSRDATAFVTPRLNTAICELPYIWLQLNGFDVGVVTSVITTPAHALAWSHALRHCCTVVMPWIGRRYAAMPAESSTQNVYDPDARDLALVLLVLPLLTLDAPPMSPATTALNPMMSLQ